MGADVAAQQRRLDQAMIAADGTDNKAAVGRQCHSGRVLWPRLKQLPRIRGMPLYAHIARVSTALPGQYTMPVPMMNIINGGEHADNNVDIQEFMVQPVVGQKLR